MCEGCHSRQQENEILRRKVSVLQEMEKQYSERLGDLARLGDVVCTEVLSYDNTDLFSPEVLAAAREIMDYVDAVRPN